MTVVGADKFSVRTVQFSAERKSAKTSLGGGGEHGLTVRLHAILSDDSDARDRKLRGDSGRTCTINFQTNVLAATNDGVYNDGGVSGRKITFFFLVARFENGNETLGEKRKGFGARLPTSFHRP